ncbi:MULTISPECIES: hypothetical protein [unclassified Rhodococcus (in: high G+C Gram-positive bacteria)]|uniref:hypothetical protein n=1 Tax=unclassified Rhodococcus (in: high G+C Gram-positive bacteria) TaxID=192944 RepID=UPI0009038D05|nr:MULTISPECIES: hypothetical protein [unclassified Rhodococcus (in: high G+C Gram-positive bacteria)]APE11046.1 hypothetical protein BO226_19095 [Rhodococcus sp. 2G]APE11102.1 hypothetical protein BO226_19425 [Rhodococcus sp. 2G]QXU53651.1 hypothetical protein KXC42_23490 [Rhodococcus sp. LW-XY12]
MSSTNITRPNVAVLEPVDTPIFDELTAHFFTTPVDTAYFFTTPAKSDVLDAQVVDVNDTELVEDVIVDGPTGIEMWLWILALSAVICGIGFLYIIGATGRIA